MRPNVDVFVGFRTDGQLPLLVSEHQFGWFSQLNASARNCTFCRSPMATSLNSARLWFWSCGLRKMLRTPVDAKVPDAGRVKKHALESVNGAAHVCPDLLSGSHEGDDA